VKKKKILIQELIAGIIAIILVIGIGMSTINTFFYIPRNQEHYAKYILARYEQEIVLESKIHDIDTIDISSLGIVKEQIEENKFEAYNCSLKNNSNIKFIVGYGILGQKLKSTQYFDNYDKVILKDLQKKYFETIEINDEFTIDNAVAKIENIIEQWEEEAINYGIKPPFTSCLRFNIVYYDILIENIGIWDSDNIHDILVKNIYK